MHSMLIILFVGALSIATVILSWWFLVSYRAFPNTYAPGDVFYIADKYKAMIPRLPHKKYKGIQKASMDCAIPGMDKETLSNLRELLKHVVDGLRNMNMDFYVTGGTLLGAELWNSLMVYGDDIDMTIMWEDRDRLWGQEFVDAMDKVGLEVFYLRWSSLTFATKEGAAVRLRMKGHTVPTCDIFTTSKHPDGTLRKVDSWNGKNIHYSQKEIWKPEWVFPLKHKEVCGIMLNMPNHPEKLLETQYGSDWNQITQSPYAMLSHKWVFQMTNMFGVWRVGQPTMK